MHARVWMGMERFWTALGTDPALAVALLEKLQALQIVAIDRATDRSAVGAFLLDDDLAHCGGPAGESVAFSGRTYSRSTNGLAKSSTARACRSSCTPTGRWIRSSPT